MKYHILTSLIGLTLLSNGTIATPKEKLFKLDSDERGETDCSSLYKSFQRESLTPDEEKAIQRYNSTTKLKGQERIEALKAIALDPKVEGVDRLNAAKYLTGNAQENALEAIVVDASTEEWIRLNARSFLNYQRQIN